MRYKLTTRSTTHSVGLLTLAFHLGPDRVVEITP